MDKIEHISPYSVEQMLWDLFYHTLGLCLAFQFPYH